MVYTVIHSLANSGNAKDFILLEFQGSFQSDETAINGTKIGEIHINNDSAYLLVGHHRIEGTRKKLPKPLVVIHKRSKQPNSSDMDIDEDSRPAVEYDVTSIVREKIAFPSRPRLIVKESLRGLNKIGG